MMRLPTVIILSTFVTLAHATLDEPADKLMDRMLPTNQLDADLEQSTLGKAVQARPGKSLPTISRSAVGNRPQISASAMRGSYKSSPLASYKVQGQQCRVPQVQGAMPVPMVQDALKSCGFAPDPMQQLALTAVAATRDVSLNAQVKQQFASLDAKTKAKVMAAEEATVDLTKTMAGITAPLNFWDPWGFSTDEDEGTLVFLRELELKHGRIGMIATLGIIVEEKFSVLLGAKPDISAVNIVEHTYSPYFWPAVFLAVSNVESKFLGGFASIDRYKEEAKKQGWTMANRIPGDFGFDPLGLKPKTPNDLKDMQNKELNNGRLAMLAAAGIIAQEWATGKKIF